MLLKNTIKIYIIANIYYYKNRTAVCVYTPVTRPYMKKGTRPYWAKGYTAVQGKTVARPYRKKSQHGRVHGKKLTRPCTQRKC